MNDLQFKKAVDYHKKNQLKKAIKIYHEIVNHADHEEALFLLGTAYIQNSDFKNGVKFLKKLIKINPKHFHAYANLAQALTKLHLFNEAIQAFNNSILLNPNFSHNYNNLGNLYFSTKNYEKALFNLNLAIAKESCPDFYFNRSKIYEKINQHAKALNDVNRFLHYHPRLYEAQMLKIDLLIHLNKFEEAKEYLDVINNQHPHEESIAEKYIALFLAKDEIDSAHDYIKKINEENKKNFYLSKIYYKSGLLDKAMASLKLIPKVKYNANIINNYGLILRDMGDETQAVQCFQKVLELEPNNNSARLNLSLIQLKNYDFTNGLKNYYYRPKPNINFLSQLSEYQESTLPTENIIIIGEQGVGDQILFLKILNKVKTFNFIFLIDERLIHFYSSNYPHLRFISTYENLDVDVEYFLFLGDFLKYFISSKQDLDCSHLKILDYSQPVSPSKSKKTRVGISWKSPLSHSETKNAKSIALPTLIKLISNFDFQLTTLQYGDTQSEITQITNDFNIQIRDPRIDLFNDLYGLIKLINSLDLVITSSNIVAHLAGVIAKKTLLLAPKHHSKIWYWHSERQSTWYPNTSIYFYENLESKHVIDEITAIISKLITS